MLIDVRLDLGLDRRRDRRAAGTSSGLSAALRARRSGRDGRSSPGDADRRARLRSRQSATRSLACVTAARENARQVREEISSDMWEQLNALFLRLKEARTRRHLVEPAALHLRGSVIEGVHLFEGITDATMAHGEGWQYLQAGRFLERAGATAALRRSLLPRQRRRLAAESRRVGRAPAIVLGARSLLPPLHRRHPSPNASPSSCCSIAEFPRSVRFSAARVESALRAHRAAAPGAAAAAGPSGSRDGCTPRSTTGRSTRSSTRIRTRISRASAATASRFTRPRTRATSCIRSRRRCLPDIATAPRQSTRAATASGT